MHLGDVRASVVAHGRSLPAGPEGHRRGPEAAGHWQAARCYELAVEYGHRGEGIRQVEVTALKQMRRTRDRLTPPHARKLSTTAPAGTVAVWSSEIP
jgi:hypothetical protein